MINLIYTILPIVTMIIGFYFGFNINKDGKLPEVKTIGEIMDEKKTKKKIKAKETETEIYLENIDNYPKNQKDC